MRAEDPVEKIHACGTNSFATSQRFILAVPNSDTFDDASVTVHPFHIDQGSPSFLGEDHLSYCTTVRGPDILQLHDVIFWEYVTFYQINRFFGSRLIRHLKGIRKK